MNDPRTEEACASCYKGRPTNPERAQFASNVRNRLILARCAPPHIYAIRKTNFVRESGSGAGRYLKGVAAHAAESPERAVLAASWAKNRLPSEFKEFTKSFFSSSVSARNSKCPSDESFFSSTLMPGTIEGLNKAADSIAYSPVK